MNLKNKGRKLQPDFAKGYKLICFRQRWKKKSLKSDYFECYVNVVYFYINIKRTNGR